MRVLYISYDGMTDPLGQSQVIPYLAGLSQRGYRFTILSCEKQARFQANKEKVRTLLEKHNIAWVPLIYHKKPPVISSLYDLFSMRKAACRLHEKERFQIVHCRSYIPGLIGMYMKKKYSTKFVFDMRGFWADERVEGNIWNIKNPLFKAIYQFFKEKEKQMLFQADYTITLTYKARDIIHGWQQTGQQSIPIEVIPCCVDTTLFDPDQTDKHQQAQLRQQLNIRKDQFVLTYLGSLGTWYMVEEMIAFFRKLLKYYPEAVFLFITQDEKTAVVPCLQKYDIPETQVVFTTAPREKVPLYLSLSSASIFFIKPVFSKQASSATKMGEIMSMGIPMITNRGVGDADEILDDAGCGLLVTTFDEENYNKTAERIEDILNLPANKIRSYSKKYFDIEEGISKYQRAYFSLQKPVEVKIS